MRLVLPVRSFRDAFSRVAPAAARRSPKPILMDVLLDVGDAGKATLAATDLDTGAVATLDLGPSCDPGRVILPRDKFAELLRLCPPEEFLEVVKSPDGKLRVAVGRTRLALPTADPDLFPGAFAGTTPDVGYRAAVADLLRAGRLALVAVDPAGANSRSAYAGTLAGFDASAGRVTFAAADGRQLAVATCPGEMVGTPAASILPRSLFDHAARVLAGCEPAAVATLAIGDRHASIAVGDALAWGRLVEGRFPGIEPITGAAYPDAATFDAPALLDAVRVAALATSDEARGVDFEFGPEGLALAAEAPDAGKSEVVVPCDWPAAAVGATLDHRFVAAILAAVGAGPVAVGVLSAKDPVRLATADATYWIMPLIRDVVAKNRGRAA